MVQMPAEDSERSGFPAWIASRSAVCPCPLGIGWEMLGGSRDPNMLFHSSFTFESCFTCFLAIRSWEVGEEREQKKSNAVMAALTHYFLTRRETNAYTPIYYLHIVNGEKLLLGCLCQLTGLNMWQVFCLPLLILQLTHVVINSNIMIFFHLESCKNPHEKFFLVRVNHLLA